LDELGSAGASEAARPSKPKSPPGTALPGMGGASSDDAINAIKKGLKKVPPPTTTPEAPPAKVEDPATVGGLLQKAFKERDQSSDNMSASVESGSDWDADFRPKTSKTPEEEAAEAAAAQKAEEAQKRQELEKTLDDAQKELAALPEKQKKDHVGESMDDTIGGLVFPEGIEGDIDSKNFEQAIKQYHAARKIVDHVAPELLQKDRMINTSKLKELLSELQTLVKAGTPELREKRAQLHKLQEQAAQAKVDLAKANLNGGDATAKQTESDLRKQVETLEREVKVLQDDVVNYTYFAKNIIETIKPPEDVVTMGDILGKAAAIREVVAASDSNDDDDENPVKDSNE
jgi:multidrug efflux pump subunit AcrA (membrane-fusion protein)